METLNSAARAAGFAMAASDDPYEDVKSEVKAIDTQWRPTPAVLLHAEPPKTAGGMTDWLSSVLGLLGRRAPASPA